MAVNDEQLAEFCRAIDALRAEYFARHDFSVSAEMERPVSFDRGKLYARIVLNNGPSRSVHCFVRLADGAIMKADGWKRPARHVRGNIANGAADVGPHGAAYLR